MRKALVGAFLVGAWVAVPATWIRAQQPDCEAARCSLQSSIDSCCSNAKNHGQFVSCVAHAVNAASRDGSIPTNCKGKVTRCAARSTCGKEGFVTCTPTCDTTTGTCVDDPTQTVAQDFAAPPVDDEVPVGEDLGSVALLGPS